ncbi:hypothetical protein B0T25DRAFT_575222 [Lasiosphaeria hispida]|uniref:GATA-type domain-containing protein n=1 Tax=Lasiosphaeria hispida TaxID=260671 RepID=A0AAJ0HTS1_9PEZI|nr:hypothetical protein B0T25DRAFT_575222 [Lasiosphaeria hispida]
MAPAPTKPSLGDAHCKHPFHDSAMNTNNATRIPTPQYPASSSSEDTESFGEGSTTLGNASQGGGAFGIEKGFWKIHHSARELLRFATMFKEHQSKAPQDGTSQHPSIPREIDMLSMTQLSWGILHAVSEITNLNQRMATQHDSARLQGRDQRRRLAQAKRRPRRRMRAIERQGCAECGIGDSPRWRHGPTGPLTLCNVCGLLFNKRCEDRRSRELLNYRFQNLGG